MLKGMQKPNALPFPTELWRNTCDMGKRGQGGVSEGWIKGLGLDTVGRATQSLRGWVTSVQIKNKIKKGEKGLGLEEG